ncbi:TPR repeat-containing protein [Brevinema andersonii]|uniref:TPR repeat-containing protein n=1 Tax=Brevinema andersonii TaxID=34097 RepID=A0A1I1D2T8_BREAD|nr:tetratricopeptide repeat protein [Brevinema andersonii]SFB69231.1 TPR repeat-containing protein [Brevinema andersonii]
MRNVWVLVLWLSVPLAAQDYTVNGFSYNNASPNFNKGLRLKGIGDYFFKQKAYAKAVPYYQQALELIPNEADIAFNLGRIYQEEKLWRLAELYYNETIALFAKSENFDKSQLHAYLARVRMAQVKYAQKDNKAALIIINELRKEESLMRSMYPEAWELLGSSFDKVFPVSAVAVKEQ